MRSAVVIGALQCAQFLIVTANLRACAQGLYVPALATDALLMLNGLVVARRVLREAATRAEITGYVIGGVVGSAAGIWVTKAVFGQ